MQTSPNAPVPTDALTLAVERMKQATVRQLRDALALHDQGHPLPTFGPFLQPFLAARAG